MYNRQQPPGFYRRYAACELATAARVFTVFCSDRKFISTLLYYATEIIGKTYRCYPVYGMCGGLNENIFSMQFNITLRVGCPQNRRWRKSNFSCIDRILYIYIYLSIYRYYI